MRLIAYISIAEDAAAVRDHLRRQPGITGVAVRSGRHWRPGDYAEPGYQRIWAPAYPGILATYAAAGVAALDCEAASEPWAPDELRELPLAEAVTILAHGKHARAELAAVGTIGPVLAINHSGRLLDHPPAYLVANDGIVAQNIGAPGLVRCVRRLHLATLPSGPWFDLGRVGVTSALFSVRCAVRLAQQALRARHIRLIGHDCLPGAGALPGTWGSQHIATCKRETAADLRQLAASGIEIDHVGWDAERSSITHADYKA